MQKQPSYFTGHAETDVLWMIMPMSFRNLFRSCCVIIDCTENFIECPTDLKARAQVWSNYKHHSMIKFLIGIIPKGTLSFISKCAGGRIAYLVYLFYR